jgi:hypothetical protein
MIRSTSACKAEYGDENALIDFSRRYCQMFQRVLQIVQLVWIVGIEHDRPWPKLSWTALLDPYVGILGHSLRRLSLGICYWGRAPGVGKSQYGR